MRRVLYHGSNKIITNPQFGVGSTTNDYGRGFYCTESLELAKEWACKNNTDGFANCYEIDKDDLSVCDLNSPDYHILNWLAVLTRNRSYWQRNSIAEDAKLYLQENFFVDTSRYDIVVGYRADDSYFSFAQDFIMGTISLQKLSRAMRLGKLGEQVMIRSQNAFDRIKYVGNEDAQKEIYYTKKLSRDLLAKQSYQQEKAEGNRLDEIYIIDIMRGRVNEDELRI